MRFTIPPHIRLLFVAPVFGALAACAASDSTAPDALSQSQPATSRGSGSDGDSPTAPTPVPGTITGTWKGLLITPLGSQPTTMFLRQSREVTGDVFILVGTTEQRLRINRGRVLNDTVMLLLTDDGSGSKESSVSYVGKRSADGRTMTGAVIYLNGPQYALDLTLQ